MPAKSRIKQPSGIKRKVSVETRAVIGDRLDVAAGELCLSDEAFLTLKRIILPEEFEDRPFDAMPTRCAVGTSAKVSVMARRAARGLRLDHPFDRGASERPMGYILVRRLVAESNREPRSRREAVELAKAVLRVRPAAELPSWWSVEAVPLREGRTDDESDDLQTEPWH